MSENIERKNTIDFWLFGHFANEATEKAKEASDQHFLNGMDWEEHRPKMLIQSPWEDECAIFEKLRSPVLTSNGAYKTSLEYAFITVMNEVHHILEDVSEFDEATPKDFRKAIAKALYAIDDVEIKAKEKWEQMVEARALYKAQHPNEEATDA